MAHAILSASASSRWLHCTPSARLERKFPDTSSPYAEEGTQAHAYAERFLNLFLKTGKTTVVINDNAEMQEAVQAYVNICVENQRSENCFFGCADQSRTAAGLLPLGAGRFRHRRHGNGVGQVL